MLSSLPGLAPRDSHKLWYTSTYHSGPPPPTDPLQSDPSAPPHAAAHPSVQRRLQATTLSRSPLARLRADEAYMHSRKSNVSNYGNSWIRPPGIPKSLYQLREEEREMREHAEAMRREALAQELAEAEGMEGTAGLEDMDDLMGEERNLDDEIPDADETTGLDGDDSGDENDEDSDDDEEEEEEDETGERSMLASRVPDDVYREALARGQDVLGPRFEGSSVVGEEEESQILREEDLIHENPRPAGDDLGMDMDMDADLDNEVPDADAGGYEHTDTEAELTSSSEEEEDDDDESIEELPRNLGGHSSSLVRSDESRISHDPAGAFGRRHSGWQTGSSPTAAGRFRRG